MDLIPSGRYFRGPFFPTVDVFSVAVFSVDFFSEHHVNMIVTLLVYRKLPQSDYGRFWYRCHGIPGHINYSI